MATKSKSRVSFLEFAAEDVADDPVQHTLAESGDDTDTDEDFRKRMRNIWRLCLKKSTAVALLSSGLQVWIQPREALYFSSIKRSEKAKKNVSSVKT